MIEIIPQARPTLQCLHWLRCPALLKRSAVDLRHAAGMGLQTPAADQRVQLLHARSPPHHVRQPPRPPCRLQEEGKSAGGGIVTPQPSLRSPLRSASALLSPSHTALSLASAVSLEQPPQQEEGEKAASEAEDSHATPGPAWSVRLATPIVVFEMAAWSAAAVALSVLLIVTMGDLFGGWAAAQMAGLAGLVLTVCVLLWHWAWGAQLPGSAVQLPADAPAWLPALSGAATWALLYCGLNLAGLLVGAAWRLNVWAGAGAGVVAGCLVLWALRDALSGRTGRGGLEEGAELDAECGALLAETPREQEEWCVELGPVK